MKAPKQLEIIKNSKHVTEMHPQSGHVERISLAGAKPTSEIDNPYNMFSCFPKGPNRALKVKPKWKPKWAQQSPH
jgi:hypothetical protein